MAPRFRVLSAALVSGVLAAPWLTGVALAAGPLAKFVASPTPIAAAGTLAASSSKTVTFTAEDSTGAAIAGAQVYLGIFATAGGGSATVGATALTTKPALFIANASGQVSVTYKSGATKGGRDELKAQNTASAPTIITRDTYCYFGGSYRFSPTPLASAGTLKGSSIKSGTLTVLASGGTAVAGATVYLSFVTAGGGSATANGTPLTATPTAFVANASGQVPISYTTPAALPATGTDTIVAQDAVTNYCTVKKDYYDFGAPASYTFSPVPVAASASLAANTSKTVTLILKDSGGHLVAGGRVYLSFAGPGTASVGTTLLSSTPRATVSNQSGVITLTFKTPSTLPAHGSVATITGQNVPSGATLSGSDSYTY